ncbi:hypothetical protein DUK53_16940 [Listeria sp. SHR_NRA_18]|uniref:hypothetical protein n=1 Tax=Listeria sp. SHR_NRA_18 TaxID=2269046 RepID=UPI000F6028A4|nr:hypothetical protein [Listeria sp. SHR_NRA_18]RQW65322.1 hypothetical protein DUK53_16940 [Listeria sp. SHR_NRA_18]
MWTKNKVWNKSIWAIIILLVIAVLVIFIHPEQKEIERKALIKEKQERSQIELYLQAKELKEGEILEGFAFEKNEQTTILLSTYTTYKIVYAAKNEDTGKQREAMVTASQNDVEVFAEEKEEENALKKRLNEQLEE